MLRAHVALLLLAATPLAAQEPPTGEPPKVPQAVETLEYQDADGNVTLRLPKAWKVEPEPADSGQIITLSIEIPGEELTTALEVHALPGVLLRPEAQLRYELPAQHEVAGFKDGTMRLEPMPHLLIDITREEKPPEFNVVIAMRRFRCRGIHVRFTCPVRTWARPEIRDAFFTTMQGIQCKLPRWPGIPVKEDAYDILRKDGFDFYFERGVSKKARKRIETCVGVVQKDFIRFHGPIERPADEPPQIFIHQDAAMHGRFSKEAASARGGMYVDLYARRVFALGYEDPCSWPEANLAWELTKLFIEERYGTAQPAWFQIGECFVAETKMRLGKNLPFVTQLFVKQQERVNSKLTDLKGMLEKWNDYVVHGEAYCAFFRAGPAKYKKAYRAFLTEFARTCDYEAAERKHLFLVDQDAMYKDLRRFLDKKLRSVRAD
jgi:hypothetical protein